MSDSISSRLANITLADMDGTNVRLGSLWAEQPAIIAFLRHYG